jgi:putative membrane protein
MNNFGSAQKSTVIALAVIALVAGCDKRDNTPAPGSRDSGSSTTTPSYQSPPPSTGGTSGTTSPPSTTTPGGSSSTGSTTGSAGGTSSGDTSSGSSGTTTNPGSTGTGTGTGTSGTGGRSSLDDPSANKLAAATPAELRSRFGVDVMRVASTSDGSAAGKLSHGDKEFIKDAAVDGLYEVEIAKIASERASNPAVKSFAQMLVNDHSAANDELKRLANSRNVELPTELPMLKRRSVDRLSKMSGSEFDREFVNKVAIKEHEKDIKRFEEASRDAKDAEVRAWAEKKLPTLRQHLADAQKLPPATASRSMDSSGTPRSGMDRPDSSSGSGGTTGSGSGR